MNSLKRSLNHTSKVVIFLIIMIFMIGNFQYDGTSARQSLTQSGKNTRKSIEKKMVPLPIRETIPGLPISLKIPKIHVDASFEYVGVTLAGAMDVPKDPSKVAWYNLGPRPGEIGSAVVVGHYGSWKNGAKSVFDNLHTLQIGDIISIEDRNKITITFIVRKIQSHDPTGDTTDIFISNDGESHLNLITCEGTWNARNKIYSKRLVIFADKVLK